jgi:hypothetical protein
VLLTREEEIWRDDGQGSWRRQRWTIYDRRLLAVMAQATFATPADLHALLPTTLSRPFTNRDLAAALNSRLALAQKMTYTLRQAGQLNVVGKQGNALLYA